MSLRSGTQKYGLPKDEWVTKDGHTRNLYLEEFLPSEIVRVRDLITSTFQQKGNMHPLESPNPSWWTDYTTFQDDHYTLEEAIEYLKRARDWQSVVKAWDSYRCEFFPRSPSYCQRAAGGYDLTASIKKLEAQLPSPKIGFDIIPQVFAEEDPSVNSGLNGNEFSEIQEVTLPSIYGGQYVPGVEPTTVTIPTPEQEGFRRWFF